MAPKYNNVVFNNHFKKTKTWAKLVRCHFDQPMKKKSRRVARADVCIYM